jgi:hypothetical protein
MFISFPFGIFLEINVLVFHSFLQPIDSVIVFGFTQMDPSACYLVAVFFFRIWFPFKHGTPDVN